MEASRLHFSHTSERADGTEASSIPTQINQTGQRGMNIRPREALLTVDQAKVEQGNERGCTPPIRKETNSCREGRALCGRFFPNKPRWQRNATSTDVRCLRRCHHREASQSGEHHARQETYQRRTDDMAHQTQSAVAIPSWLMSPSMASTKRKHGSKREP